MAGTDYSHLTNDELIKGIKALDLPDYIRSKAYGVDVRETLAQMTEMLMQLAYNQGMNPQEAQDFVYRINNKIDKGNVTMSDLTQEVKEALTGGAVAVVGKNSVGTENIKDASVTRIKTDFVKTGKNLADPSYFKKGQVTNTSGELVTSPSGFSSFYKLPLEQNTTYTLNGASSQYVLYDQNGSFLAYNDGSTKTFTTTGTQFFISINGTEKIQIEKGEQSTSFERFYLKLREEASSQRAQLSSDIYVDVAKNKIVIPVGTIVKDTYKQYQTAKPQAISLGEVTTTNKFLYFNPFEKNFVLTAIEANQNETLFFIGSGYFNENLLFENYIGDSDKHIKAYVLGKNLADPSLYQKGKVLSTSGTVVTSPSGNSSVINIPIEPNTAYALTNASHFGFFDKNGSFIKYDGTDNNFFTSPENAYFVTVNIYPDNLNKFQIEEGTVATTVEPYQRTYVWEDKAPIVEVDQSTVLKISFNLDDETSKVNRLDGLSRSNMDEVYPFNSVKLCNVNKTEWGATKITYSDEAGFTRDGSNGDVMSEIPKFYMKRERNGRIETISISGQELDGYSIHPAFVENGKILDAVYIGVYDGHIKGSQLRSISSTYPTSNYNITDFRSNAKYNRRGFGVLDWRSLNMLQVLFMFYFADRNSQSALAPGLTQFPWQTGSECIAQNTATATNTVRINSNVDGYDISHFVVGQSVQVVETEGLWQHSEDYTHKITNISDAGGGMLDIAFDGEPKNIVAGTSMIYSRSQITGLTDGVNGHVGVSSVLGGGYGQEAVKFLHIENLWGNIWSLIDGVVVIDLVPYVGMNMDDYSSDVTEIKSKYVPLDTKVPLQDGNNQDAGTENAYYIKEMSYDKLNKNIMLPIGIGGGASPTTMYSDPFYSYETGDYIPAFGGGIDHERRAGLFSTRFWTKNDDGRAAILEGARNQFKNI